MVKNEMEKINNQKGTLLIEILLAILIAAIVIGGVILLMTGSSQSGKISGTQSAAIALAQEGLEAMEAIRDTTNGWHNIYLPPDGNGSVGNKGDSYLYYAHKNGSAWELSTDVANRDIIINETTYSRTIYIYNVSRNATGDREIVTSGGVDDPSTQKIKVKVSQNNSKDIIFEEYLTRWKNNTFLDTNWSGGSGQAGPVASPNSSYASDDGNIDTGTAGSIKLKQ
jgi:Tfp pilus assembly protein PilV